MSSPVLSVKNITKRYQEFLAVDRLSFSLKEGEILGLLGPNGAGKTTTIQMLLGLTTPDAGKISYFGKEFSKNEEWCLSQLNFASAYSRVQGRLSVWQNLRVYAGLYGIDNYKKRIQELLELMEIEEARDKLFWHLSSGQQTRVILAKALLNRPRLLLMDEPTASLDPDIAHKITQVVRQLRDTEKTSILFTSHNMDEVARVCDRVMFLNRGKLLMVDTPLELTKKVGEAQLVLTFDGTQKPIKDFFSKENLKHSFIRKHIVEVTLKEELIPKILFGLSKQKIWVTSIDIKKPTLEDVFLRVSRKGADGLEKS